MVYHAKKAASIDEARHMLQEVLDNGKALEKFKEFIAAQGGDSSYVQDTEKI